MRKKTLCCAWDFPGVDAVGVRRHHCPAAALPPIGSTKLQEIMMSVLLYALYCLVLPLWVFAGLYLVFEFAEILKKRHAKK